MRAANHELVQLERELAEGQVRTALDSYGHPLGEGWKNMEWDYLKEVFPGKQETLWLRKCWKYAVARGLIKVRRRTHFKFI